MKECSVSLVPDPVATTFSVLERERRNRTRQEQAERNELRRHYESEMDRAMDSPGVEMVCRQRYTFRERIAKLMGGVDFTPKHRRLTVTFFPGMGFLWGSASYGK